MSFDHVPGQGIPLNQPQASNESVPSDTETSFRALTDEMPTTWHNCLYAKRSKVSKLFGIGTTLLRELHTAGSANFDKEFPPPFTMSKRGPAYFDILAILAWVKSRQAIAANDAAGKSR